MRRKYGLPIITLLISMCCVSIVQGQLRRVENKVRRSFPLEIEFKSFDSSEWVRDFEIKVTNKSKKPIYYLYLILYFDTKDSKGHNKAFTFKFGNPDLYSAEKIAEADDPYILPNESYTFKADTSTINTWEFMRRQESYVGPTKGELHCGWLNFGDGSGIKGGGHPFKK